MKRSTDSRLSRIPAVVAIGLVRLYRLTLSPVLHILGGPFAGCRYYPCCSEYSLEAYRRFGFVRGTLLTGWRLLRCGPWSRGGIDPVPEECWLTAFGRRQKDRGPRAATINPKQAETPHG